MLQFSIAPTSSESGFSSVNLPASSSLSLTFDMHVRLLASHPLTKQDTLTVSRGPIVYTAESVDNPEIDSKYPHFEGVGITTTSSFEQTTAVIEDVPVVLLKQNQPVYALNETHSRQAHRVVSSSKPARTWTQLDGGLVLVPWFARANRGGAGRVRTAFLRADEAEK